MDRSTKLYAKAIRYYNDGYIEKAMNYCEKSISENLKNTSAINLKGLLYYLKGELESAQVLWKMNYQVNKDLVSKKYLEGSKNDEERKLLYMAALKAIKELKIREALNILERCSDSDFNSININNCIALCYIKIGEYDKAVKYINLVIKTDKANKTAADNKKELVNLGVIKRDINLKAASVLVASVSFLVILGFSFKSVINTFNNSEKLVNKTPKMILGTSAINTEGKSEKQVLNNEINNHTEEKKAIEEFPTTEIQEAVSSKNFDRLDSLLSYWGDRKELSINQKNLLLQAKELLHKEGIEFFYSNGMQAMNIRDYKNALNYFGKGLAFSDGHYLDSHIIYLTAVNYKNSSDLEKAIEFYKKYDSKYPKGDYEEEVLYELALAYKNIDVNGAKDYSKKLSELYPKSIYNNSIIKDILSK